MTATVAASPTGARVGFTSASFSGTQLAITVAPKVWRRESPRSRWFEPRRETNRHHAMTLFETDRLSFDERDGVAAGLMTAMLTVSRDSQANGELYWDSSLIAPDVPASRPSPGELALNGSASHEETTASLLNLFDCLDLLSPQSADLFGAPARSVLHRPIIYRRFLEEVFARVHAARRGYRTVRVTRTTVRGRLDSRSVARHAATGEPGLVCCYDELTESTILLQVVCAALEWIAEGRAIRSPYFGRYSEKQIRHDAVALRRNMSEIARLAPRQAVVAGSRLRLSRLDQPWSEALALAILVLRETELQPGERDRRPIEAVELSIPTDKLWERIVHEALSRSVLYPVQSPRFQAVGLTENPWLSRARARERTQPDNVAWSHPDVWIVDAKYKTPAATAPPTRDDQYQMYAYSHLVRDEPNRVRAVVLVYPGHGVPQRWTRGRDSSESPVELISLKLPFPRAGDVHDGSSWDRYIDRCRNVVNETLGLTAQNVATLSA